MCTAAPHLRPKYAGKCEWCVAKATAHIWTERQVVLESVSPEGAPQTDSPEGRLLNPGHAIEAGWFLLQHNIIEDHRKAGGQPAAAAGVAEQSELMQKVCPPPPPSRAEPPPPPPSVPPRAK